MEISLIAKVPLPEYLAKSFEPQKKKNTTNLKSLRYRELKKKGKIVDLPVTFHTKVKSSGYGSKPPVMYLAGKKPKTQQKKRNPIEKHYNMHSGPPINPEKNETKGTRKIHNGPIMNVSFNGIFQTKLINLSIR